MSGTTAEMATADGQSTSPPTTAPPISLSRLKEIANEACSLALSTASSYEHTSTESWNHTIVTSILESLVKETSASSTQPVYKFVTNSTIIQHVPSSSPSAERRGMHSAAVAYWNSEKDGMWTFKYEAAETKGLDVMVWIIWVST